MPVGQVHTVARVEDVPRGSGRVVQAGEQEVALFHCNDGFYATQAKCLHMGGPVGRGARHAMIANREGKGARMPHVARDSWKARIEHENAHREAVLIESSANTPHRHVVHGDSSAGAPALPSNLH